jgi:hypothetical protein
VLESPELLEIIFDYCDMTTLVQISLVDRFFEATTAPIIYGKVNLSHPQLYVKQTSWDTLFPRPMSACWQIKTTLSSCDGTLTSRQVRNMSYARNLQIRPEKIPYDLSSCSFARVQVLEILPGHQRGTYSPYTYSHERYAENMRWAGLVANAMAEIPDLRPSTVIDETGVTFPVEQGDRIAGTDLEAVKGSSNTPNHHTIRLVTRDVAMCHALCKHWGARNKTTVYATGGRRTLLHAFYPNLVEIVFFSPIIRYEHLQTQLVLVEDGYKVVLAGYQEGNCNREHVKNELHRAAPAMSGPYAHRLPTNVNQLIDNLIQGP